MGNKTQKTIPILTSAYETDDSEDSDFGEPVIAHISDPQEQANLISTTWKQIYKPHNEDQYKTQNSIRVNNWFNSVRESLNHDETVDLGKLVPDHPLLRPIESKELAVAIAKTPDKSPGPSGIKTPQIKLLPNNFFLALRHIFDSILRSPPHFWSSEDPFSSLFL